MTSSELAIITNGYALHKSVKIIVENDVVIAKSGYYDNGKSITVQFVLIPPANMQISN
jgi:hypothetical protein